eukprot:scaffold14721_cov120-Isochrysis_galbana.AAC.2
MCAAAAAYAGCAAVARALSTCAELDVAALSLRFGICICACLHEYDGRAVCITKPTLVRGGFSRHPQPTAPVVSRTPWPHGLTTSVWTGKGDAEKLYSCGLRTAAGAWVLPSLTWRVPTDPPMADR